MARYLASPCCGAAVVGMIEVTLHPRYRTDGTTGPIIDTMRHIRRYVEHSEEADPHEAYCAECGAPVEVPHKCDEPWRHDTARLSGGDAHA